MIARLRRLSHDDLARRLGRNVRALLSAQAVSAVLGLVALAVVARALGPDGLGVLALIEAYVRTVDRFVRLESWQTLLRHGMMELAAGREESFRRLVKASTIFDAVAAAAAAVVALAGLALAAPLLGFSARQTWVAAFFASTLFLFLSSTPTAVLRLFDRFDLLARVSVAGAVLRLVLALAAWAAGGDIVHFAAVLALGEVAQQTALLALGWRELRRRGHGSALRLPLRGIRAEHPGLFAFLLNANATVIARQGAQRLDLIIVGAMLDPAAVGFLQLAKRTAQTAFRFAAPLQQAIYPELARLWAEGRADAFRRVTLGINTGALGLAVVFAAAGVAIMPAAVDIVFGDAFAAAVPVMQIQAVAVAAYLAGTSLAPAFQSMGRADLPARITLSSTAIFFVVLPPFVQLWGASGASAAHLLNNALWLCAALWLFRRVSARTAPLQAAGA